MRAQLYNSARTRHPRELAANEALLRARVAKLWQTRCCATQSCRWPTRSKTRCHYYEATFLREIPKIYADLEKRTGPIPRAQLFAHGPMDWRRPRRQPTSPRKRCNTLSRQSDVALRHYPTEVHYLGGELSLSARLVRCRPEMEALAQRSPTPASIDVG